MLSHHQSVTIPSPDYRGTCQVAVKLPSSDADGGNVTPLSAHELGWLAIGLISAWTVLMCLLFLCVALDNAQARCQLRVEVLQRKMELAAFEKRMDPGRGGNDPNALSWEDSVEILPEDEAAAFEQKQAA